MKQRTMYDLVNAADHFDPEEQLSGLTLGVSLATRET